MQTKQFRIGELAKKLGIQTFVIRFWEKEFNITPIRSGGQQRFYTKKELALFTRIKELLYNEGLTISGAKKQLNSGATHTKASEKMQETAQKTPQNGIIEQLVLIRKQLLKLKENF